MSRKNNTSGIWKFLELSGVLETGTAEEIARKRKEYWNERKRLSKQQKRRKQKEFKVFLNDKELSVIAKAARAHSLSRTRYIKQAALAYSNRQYLVPDQSAVNHVRQLLSLNLSVLQELADAIPGNVTDGMIQQMTKLERQVLQAICDPPEYNPQKSDL